MPLEWMGAGRRDTAPEGRGHPTGDTGDTLLGTVKLKTCRPRGSKTAHRVSRTRRPALRRVKYHVEPDDFSSPAAPAALPAEWKHLEQRVYLARSFTELHLLDYR